MPGSMAHRLGSLVEGIEVALQGGMLKLKPRSDWICALGKATWPFSSSEFS